MKKEVFEFRDINGNVSKNCVEYFKTISEYAERFNLANTAIALNLATEMHYGAFRDGGEPYIIHPLEITRYLILLNVRNAIFDMNLNQLHNNSLAETQTNFDLDILLSTSLLHDVAEDCQDKLQNGIDDFVNIYGLNPLISEFVLILTKDKTQPNFDISDYYQEICNYWQTLLIKVADRTSNCSTIDAFNERRMEKYVRETKHYFYKICSTGKTFYPSFSRIFTVMKYLIVSICETVASALNLQDIITKEDYEKSFYFLKGFAIGCSMENTLKALPLAKEYYKDLRRKSGDPFIIHPLRVCSYLVSLKIDDDTICAAALLHEIIKKCKLDYNGIEIVTKYNLDSSVLNYIRLLANCGQYPMDVFYDVLKQSPEVLLLKLSNRANTCTILINSSYEEIKSYVEECEKYIYPLCEYGINHYPQYANSIQVMQYQISSLCHIVKKLRT